MKNLSRVVRCGALACSVLLGVALALAAFWGAPEDNLCETGSNAPCPNSLGFVGHKPPEPGS